MLYQILCYLTSVGLVIPKWYLERFAIGLTNIDLKVRYDSQMKFLIFILFFFIPIFVCIIPNLLLDIMLSRRVKENTSANPYLNNDQFKKNIQFSCFVYKMKFTNSLNFKTVLIIASSSILTNRGTKQHFRALLT